MTQASAGPRPAQEWPEQTDLTRLYDELFPRIYAYVRAQVDSAADAEDLVADTFLRVVASLDRFEWRHEAAFAAWLFRIAHNLVCNFQRQRRRHAPPLALDWLPDRPGDDLAPDAALLRQERAEALHRALAELAPRQREVIALRFFGGLRNQEIAALLDLDARTVSAYLCRGLEELQARLPATPSFDRGSPRGWPEMARPWAIVNRPDPLPTPALWASLVAAAPQADDAFGPRLREALQAELQGRLSDSAVAGDSTPPAVARSARLLDRVRRWLQGRLGAGRRDHDASDRAAENRA
jgi:RNA polymerase sigma-70 factor (ECF subfamily)